MKTEQFSPHAECPPDFAEPVPRYVIEPGRSRCPATDPGAGTLQNAAGGSQRQRGEGAHTGGPAAAQRRRLAKVPPDIHSAFEAVTEGMEGSVIGGWSGCDPGAVPIDEGTFRSIDANGVAFTESEGIVDGGAGRDRCVDVVTIGSVELVWLETALELTEERIGKKQIYIGCQDERCARTSDADILSDHQIGRAHV